MLSGPAPGSLAARSDLKNKLAFLQKKTEGGKIQESPSISLRDPQAKAEDKSHGPRDSSRGSSSTSNDQETQAGWILKQALDLHFKKERSFVEEAFDPPLAEYIKEVFLQLDYHKTGAVSREDFDILCRILDISSSPPSSYRNSGIEWLSSYRTQSPVSPIKADKMSDIKYHRHDSFNDGGVGSLSTISSSVAQNPHFLFTFGPRPFWELWPQKKRRKRRLNFEEFTRSLLEQWAKSKGISLSKVNHCFPPIAPLPKRKRGSYRTKYYRLLPESPSTEPKALPQRPPSSEDIRSKQFLRRANRISRRCHFLKRLSRQLDCLKSSRRRNNPMATSPRGLSNPLLPLPTQVEVLEKTVSQQKGEIKDLRSAIQEMRSSLHLSDAQNLALQVLLFKMKDLSLRESIVQPIEADDAEISPSSSSEVKPSFASRSVAESEKQLENLVHELREMSQTKYPSVGSSSVHQASSNNSTLYNSTKLEDSPFEEEISATSAALGGAKEDLILTQRELQQTVIKLQMKEIEMEENSLNLSDAYKALERAQEELNKLREDLEEAQTALDSTKQELYQTNEELSHTKRTLARTDSALKDTEKRLSQLSQNRLSLVLELNTTREILASSLNKVQDLELQTQRVPFLEARIRELEDSRAKKCESNERALRMTHSQLRPLSTIDSGLYSTSSSDSDESKSGSGLKGAIPVPCHPASEDESPRCASSSITEGKRPPKPPRQPDSPKASSSSNSSSNHLVQCTGSKVSPTSKGAEEMVLRRLRQEIQTLKNKFSESQEEWEKDRNQLLENKLLVQFEDPEFQVLEAERIRLSLLEEKIKEVLSMLRTLNSMNISPSSLGRLVLEAVEHSISPGDGEVQVFKFLNHLYHGTRDYERVSGENMIQRALDAIEMESRGANEEEAD